MSEEMNIPTLTLDPAGDEAAAACCRPGSTRRTGDGDPVPDPHPGSTRGPGRGGLRTPCHR